MLKIFSMFLIISSTLTADELFKGYWQTSTPDLSSLKELAQEHRILHLGSSLRFSFYEKYVDEGYKTMVGDNLEESIKLSSFVALFHSSSVLFSRGYSMQHFTVGDFGGEQQRDTLPLTFRMTEQGTAHPLNKTNDYMVGMYHLHDIMITKSTNPFRSDRFRTPINGWPLVTARSEMHGTIKNIMNVSDFKFNLRNFVLEKFSDDSETFLESNAFPGGSDTETIPGFIDFNKVPFPNSGHLRNLKESSEKREELQEKMESLRESLYEQYEEYYEDKLEEIFSPKLKNRKGGMRL